ncbi:MAG: AAA family ATPase, partial [Acidobacteria bacterium]|nr:AAA family ATPase [Acidobacteriota bacterium]
MLTSLRLINFKNFGDETLHMGPLTVIVGANASGKSNLRDAFRFLHGIGRGYTVSEIIGGKYGSGGQQEWAPIRGAADEIVRFGQRSFTLQVRAPSIDYLIEVARSKKPGGMFRVTKEILRRGPRTGTTYTSHPGYGDPVQGQDDETHLLLRMEKTGSQRKYGDRIAVRPDQPALTQIHEHRRVVKAHKEHVQKSIDLLVNMRFLDLEPNRMREAAFPGQTRLGDGGENLPTVLRSICADPQRRKALAEWTRELTPMDVRDFDFPVDRTTGRVQLVFKEANDRRVSAYAASDGTLRFIAMLAGLIGTETERLYVFEEIDNGIHPSRMRLLLDLIEGQTEKEKIQVVTTTHSPDLLALVRDNAFENTSVVCRLEQTDDAVIRRVNDLPNAGKIRRTQGLGRLHASG